MEGISYEDYDSSRHVNAIVKATCVLRNMLQTQSTPAQNTQVLHDCPDPNDVEGLRDLDRYGYRGTNNAIHVRDLYKDFFSRDESVPWQLAHVRRGFDVVQHD